jgi:hypothetical protein
MADAGLSDLCVDAHAPDAGAQVSARAEAALARPDELRARLRDVRARMRERTAAFDGRVAALLAPAE